MGKQPRPSRPSPAPAPSERPEILEATVTGLNEYGDGVISLKGRTIKVARTVPGDRIKIKLPRTDKRFVYADLVRVIKASEHRVDPGCESFAAGCGGCQWLHLDYAQQLAWKTRILRDMFKQRCPIGVKVPEILPMDSPAGFRNKLSLRTVDGRLVFMQDFSELPLSPRNCRVETAANQAAWHWLRKLKVPADVLQLHLRSVDVPDGQPARVGAHLFVKGFSATLSGFADLLLAGPAPADGEPASAPGLAGVGATCRDEYRLLVGSPWLEQAVGNLRFRIPHNGFFQTNHRQAERLAQLAMSQLAPRPDEAVLDLYCGSGYFTLPIARAARRVLGVENNAASVEAGKANASLNDLGNIAWQAADVGRALSGLRAGEWASALLDPPRSGCEPAVLGELIRLAPRRLVYVSCSPESLMQDLKVLTRDGYRVVSCQAVDMFPHSFHIETLVCLERN